MRKSFLIIGGFLAAIVISLLIGAASPLPILRNQWTTNFPGQQIKDFTYFDSTMRIGLANQIVIEPLTSSISFPQSQVGDQGWFTGAVLILASNANFIGTVTASSLNAATNVAAFTYITNPIVSGVFWTNTTGARLTLFINFTLTDSTVSGSPSMNMTNVANGDWVNATNSFVLTGTSSGRAQFMMSTNDWVIATNKSSGNASANVNSSFAYKQ